MPDIPATAEVVDHDFDASASPPPGNGRRGFVQHVGPDPADPGHLATDDEWAQIVARAEGGRP